ncbi:hypothetical protein FACS1894196_4470 [Clostridia bacterium]|nr:hypothetical protein FACS1894196_4470 [Clostridia bacterium]
MFEETRIVLADISENEVAKFTELAPDITIIKEEKFFGAPEVVTIICTLLQIAAMFGVAIFEKHLSKPNTEIYLLGNNEKISIEKLKQMIAILKKESEKDIESE